MSKTVEIIPPEGYEVDKEKSTFQKIHYRKIKKGLPESWEDLNSIGGWYTNMGSEVKEEKIILALPQNKNIFSSKELAEASLAVAQLSQLREVARDGWKPDWKNQSEKNIQ